MRELRMEKRKLKEEFKIVLMAAGILNASDDNGRLRSMYLSEEKYYRDEISRISSLESSIREAYRENFINGYKEGTGDEFDNMKLGNKFEDTIERSFRKTYGLDEEDEEYSNQFREEFENTFRIVIEDIINVALNVGLTKEKINKILLGVEDKDKISEKDLLKKTRSLEGKSE